MDGKFMLGRFFLTLPSTKKRRKIRQTTFNMQKFIIHCGAFTERNYFPATTRMSRWNLFSQTHTHTLTANIPLIQFEALKKRNE